MAKKQKAKEIKAKPKTKPVEPGELSHFDKLLKKALDFNPKKNKK